MSVLSLVVASALVWMGVDPYHHEAFLPTTEVVPAKGPLKIASAIGEIESASFLVRSYAPAPRLDARLTDFAGPDGAKIPASAVDLRVVKVFWAGVSQWDSDRHGRNEPLKLMPKAILHDDGLVRVDLENKLNFLRVDYADGQRYVDILSDGRKEPLKSFLEPFADAPAYVPFDLPANFTKQFWLTVKTPLGVKPGVYRGELALSSSSGAKTVVPLELEVYPFELPLPRTHYAPEKRYRCGIMGFPGLREMHAKTKDLATAEKVLANIYRSAAEHNIQFGTGEDFKDGTTDDLAVRALFIRHAAGLQTDVLFFGMGLDHGWYGSAEGKTADEDAAACREAIAKWIPYVDLQIKTLKKYAGDDARVIMSGRSEASAWGVKREQPFVRELERRGSGMIAETGRDTSKTFAWGLTVANVSADSTAAQARRWHEAGGEIVGYYAPATSVCDPDVWRRRGIRNWFADYDGILEMAWMHASNPWNQRRWGGDMYIGEALVLCDRNGVVPTLSYEAYREIADDIAYFSLHRLLSEKALASTDAAVRALGRAEWEWLERTEPELVVDLTAFRREVAKRCVALQAKTGPLPSESWTRAKPTLEKLPPMTKAIDEKIPEDAIGQAKYWCARLRRDLALKALDAEIARSKEDPAKRNSLGRLYAARLETMLTVTHYEEKFAEGELKAAAEMRTRVFTAGGASASQKFAVAMRVVDMCVDAGATDLAQSTLDDLQKWIASLGGDPQKPGWKALADFRLAEVCRLKGEWKRAVSTAVPLARAEGLNLIEVGGLIGECAEKAGDAVNAAFGDKLALDSLSKEQVKEKAHWQRQFDRVAAAAKKNAKPPPRMVDEGEPISLDDE